MIETKPDQWLLLISPLESTTNNWEVLVFNSEEVARQEAAARDLTKTHYFLPVTELVSLLEKEFGD